MEIKQFQVKNFGRFTQMDIPLAPTSTKNSNITVLIGNNGTGKTTLLKALATSLSWFVARLRSEKGSGNAIHETHIKNKANAAEIDIAVFDPQGQEHNPHADPSDFLFCWSQIKAKKGRKATRSSHFQDLNTLVDFYREQLTRNDKFSLPLIAFYPVERVVLDIPLKVMTKHSFNQLDGYDNSLNQGVDFRRFFEWFREREDSENEGGLPGEVFEQLTKLLSEESDLWAKLKSMQASSRDRQLTAVRQAISSFMPGFDNLRIRRKPRLHMSIDKNDETLNVAQLSQGEKSLMALIGDIARRLAMMNPALDNPLHGDGVILIDEVDLHLHPRWQRTLLERLEKTFPHCQFVLTTHSPLIISDSKDVLCYSLDDGELTEMDNLYGLDANQILEEVMETASRNSRVAEQIQSLMEAAQDGELNLAKTYLAQLENDLPTDHIELLKAKLLIRKLELRRAQNQ